MGSEKVSHPSLVAGWWRIEVEGSKAKAQAWVEIFEEDGHLEGHLTLMPIIVGESVTVGVADGVVTLRHAKMGLEWSWPIRNPVKATLRQHGFSLGAIANRTSRSEFESSTRLERPQHPVAPFPYEVRDVSVPVPGSSVVLSGTMLVPAKAKHSSGVVFISGSGPQDRDETVMGHRPFAVIADYLARKGIASIRVDDRGVGQSTGDFAETTAVTRVDDTLAVLRFFKGSTGVKSDKVGLLGHSEGGVIAAATAAKEPVAFVVMLATPGLPLVELLPLQKHVLLQRMGMDEDKASKEAQAVAALLAATKVVPVDEVPQVVERVLREQKPDQRKLARDIEVKAAAKQLSNAWLRSYLDADPIVAIDTLRVPTLALLGELDTQVPPVPNESALKSRLRGNSTATIEILAKMNHALQPGTTGLPDEYGRNTQTIDVALLARVAEWIDAAVEQNSRAKGRHLRAPTRHSP